LAPVIRFAIIMVAVVLGYRHYNDLKLMKKYQGKPVTNLIVKDAHTGKNRMLWDHEGPLLMVFWKIDDVFTVLELQKIRTYLEQGDLTADGIVIINPIDERDKVKRFLEEKAEKLGSYVIDDSSPELNIKVSKYPLFVFVDEKFKVLHMKEGISFLLRDDLKKYIYEE